MVEFTEHNIFPFNRFYITYLEFFKIKVSFYLKLKKKKIIASNVLDKKS